MKRKARRPIGLAALLLVAFAMFAGLGVWQIQRMHWKHALIARVDARIHAEPVALPGNERLKPELDYLRVRATGIYRGGSTALVRAATRLGTGYWTMTPLRLADGRQVWINRGFVPAGTSAKVAGASAPEGPVEIVGLLRSTEPGGSILQSNRPQEDRWYSRDVVALARARGIGAVAPLFIDVQTETGAPVAAPVAAAVKPVAGLTQVSFPDSHLSYALTWFTMALLSLVALAFIWRKA